MNVTFEEYKSWIDKYINNHDTREINFQNDVVKRLFENLIPAYDIVCVETKRAESKNHDYYAYSGKYIKNGKEKPITPDLLICQNWDWYNVNNKNIKYISTVEVKSPYGSEAIYKKNKSEYPMVWNEKIGRHLSANKIDKVIYTDTFKWEFYDNDKGIDNPESILLVNPVKIGRGYSYMWKEDADIEFNNLIEFLKDYLRI